MILDLILSIVITLGGAQSPTGGFNECPPATDPDTVAAVLITTSPVVVQEV